MIKGLAVSPGINSGMAYVISSGSHLVIPRREIAEGEIRPELARFDAAIKEAERELLAVQKEVKQKIGKKEGEIFAAQILILKDSAFLNEVSLAVLNKKTNVEAALASVVEKYSRVFSEIEDVYFRERASDIRDVGRRILSLLTKQGQETSAIPDGSIVVADELLPSTTAQMEIEKIWGIITERGGKTSHSSILARSLGIPAVIGVKDACLKIKTGDFLIVDALAGTVFVNPGKQVRDEYEKLESDFKAHRNALKELIDLPNCTQDGTRISLFANIGKIADAATALLFKAEGIGLYRTEFSFLIRDQFPTEEAQYQIYKALAERLNPALVRIRVLDLGGDKILPYFPRPQTKNPLLGERGMRLLLKHQDILATQLRAILRVSVSFPVSILLPMVTSVEEVIQSKKILENVKSSLKAEGVKFNPRIPLGVMIEVPSAVMIARRLAREVDFLSLGTNDLIQYLLAADRASDTMIPYYEPFHPAVLQAIKFVVGAAREEGKELSVCGEMGGDPAYTELLLGLGIRNFSVAPGEILEVKEAIRSIVVKRAQDLAERVLELGTVQEIQECLKNSKLSDCSKV